MRTFIETNFIYAGLTRDRYIVATGLRSYQDEFERKLQVTNFVYEF